MLISAPSQPFCRRLFAGSDTENCLQEKGYNQEEENNRQEEEDDSQEEEEDNSQEGPQCAKKATKHVCNVLPINSRACETAEPRFTSP